MKPQEFFMSMNALQRLLIIAATLLVANTAWAHPNSSLVDHQLAFFSGLLHPLTGPDHLLVMLAVGLWARFHSRHVWLAPALFVCSMAVGFVASALSGILPDPEIMIAMSVLIMGLLLGQQHIKLGRLMWPMLLSFGLFHGMAHGLEADATARTGFMLGMLLCTCGLHLAGSLLGRSLMRLNHALLIQRVSGWSMALFGVSLLAPFVWTVAA
ncbi:MAG: hypothetical protein EBT70_05450 [Betaproteobacteria bacterium]|nr:hypothetical protein [Betaproteobacteria bacterium]